MRRGWTFLLLALALLPAQAWAHIRLETQADRREVLVGDPIRLKVTAFFSPEVTLEPWPAAKTLGSFEVLGVSSGPVESVSGNATATCLYTLAIFETGVSTIPPLAVGFKLADGATGQIATPEVPILVKTVLTKETRDIRGNKDLADLAWIFWTMLILAGTGGAFWLYRRYRKHKEAGPKRPPSRPAHETALEALQSLEASLSEPSKIFYSRLSDILRAYLEGRYGLPALDRTTSELFTEMRRLGLDTAVCLNVRGLMEVSDLAKFAKWEQTEEEKRADISRTRDLVLQTRAPDPVATPTAGAAR